MLNVNVLGAVKKCYWTLALLVMIGGMSFSVYALTAAYLSYPIDVSISVHREPQLVFPAVTICNMSPVKKSALEASSKIIDIWDKRLWDMVDSNHNPVSPTL